MDKVKVNKEVFDSLKNAEFFFNGNLEAVVIDIARGYKFKSSQYQALNSIGKDVILKIYKYGYELEETAEEKILAEYKMGYYNEKYEMGYRDGIATTLMHLGIKIKGINE